MLRAPRTAALVVCAAVGIVVAFAVGDEDPDVTTVALDEVREPGGEHHVGPGGSNVRRGLPTLPPPQDGLRSSEPQQRDPAAPEPEEQDIASVPLIIPEVDTDDAGGPRTDDGASSPAAEGAGARGGMQAASLDAGPLGTLEPVGTTGEGFEIAPGGASAGEGETVTYTVELEPAVGADLGHLVAAIEDALHDQRSWARDVRLERIEDPEEAYIRVLLATPDTVDALCGEADLDTEGIYSCWNGTIAALNSARWQHGAHAFDDLTTYRRYLVNHEVGHGLGHGHVECPGSGELAPVMMQQTITTDGCEANGWVYPDEGPSARPSSTD